MTLEFLALSQTANFGVAPKEAEEFDSQENVRASGPLAIQQCRLHDYVDTSPHRVERCRDRRVIGTNAIDPDLLASARCEVRQVGLLVLKPALAKQLEHRIPGLGSDQLPGSNLVVDCA